MASENQRSNEQRKFLKTQFSNEERRTGIVRLLAEAYCSSVRKQERLKKFQAANENPMQQGSGYDFLH